MFHKITTKNCVYPFSASSNDIVENKEFQLIGTVNHSGPLDQGHYTAFINSCQKRSWLLCNEAAVLNSSEDKVNNTSSYLFFFEMV